MSRPPSAAEKHTAGALDIRNIIGGLLGVYGVILVLMGLFGDKELDKTGDVNANLWAGLAMLVVAAVFIALGQAQADRRARPRRPAGPGSAAAALGRSQPLAG